MDQQNLKSQESNQDKLVAALEYYFSLNWEAFPVYLRMRPNKKGELKKIPYMEPYRGITISKEEAIDRVYSGSLGYVPNGIAVKTGKESGIIVVDADKKNGVDGCDKLLEICGRFSDNTPAVKSQSGGKHYFFAYDERIANIADRVAEIDILSDGKLVFVPPTEVSGGGKYNWLVEPTLPLPLMPEELVEWILEHYKEREQDQIIPVNNLGTANYDNQIVNLPRPYVRHLNMILRNMDNTPIGKRSEADFGFIATAIRMKIPCAQIKSIVRGHSKFMEKEQSGHFVINDNYTFPLTTTTLTRGLSLG